MRLTCPKCSAQYEVPDEVIPEGGRDVQCSNCEETWFQEKTPSKPADVEPKPPQAKEPEQVAATEVKVEDTAETETPEAEAPKPPKTDSDSNLDPSVASILREEAEREAGLRAKETENLESQPDLGLEAHTEPEAKVAPKRPAATETASEGSRRDVLPDVEAISTTLRSDTADDTPEATEPPRKSSGFIRGFGLILTIGIVLYLVYGNARQISDAVPQAEPILKPYVSLVDQARIWLESQAAGTPPQE